MIFFVNEDQRKTSGSTCYLEFQKGNYNDKCWLPDSISIYCELWDEHNLSDLFTHVVKDFDYFGTTKISKKQWKEIVKLSKESHQIWQEIIAEADLWVKECFKEYDIFTIIGM